MKKVYDWDIKIFLYMVDTKQTLGMIISIHTTFKEVANKIADVMGMEYIHTFCEFFIQDHHYPIKQSQTLLQNKIKDGQRINVKLLQTQGGYPTANKYINKMKLINHDEYHLYEPKTQLPTYGLIVDAMCQNPKCLAYCRDTKVTLGLGEFAYNTIMHGQKCYSCPYKDRQLHPAMVIKQLKLVNCYWRAYGTYRAKEGYITDKDFPLFQKVEGEQNLALYKLIEGYNWTDLRLVIKSL